jgi:replicative DNA helicase
MTNRVPPNALDIEKAVLGAILLEKEAINLVSEMVKPEMFYSTANQVVYEAIMTIHAKSHPVDLLTVKDELTATRKLEMIGGSYYLVQLTNDVVSSGHTANHCKKIVEKYLLRQLVKIGADTYSKSFDENSDPFEIIEQAEKLLTQLSQSINAKDFKSIDSSLMEVFSELEENRHRTESITGVPTGFTELNKSTCGWQPTDLVILAARPKCGKTAMALNFGLNASLGGTGVGFFSMEMSSSQLVKRVLSNKAGIYLQTLRDARLDDEQMMHLYERGVQKLAGIPFYIDDTAALSVPEFKAKARRMVTKYKVGLLVVDYLQLMQGDKNLKNQNREQVISSIARQLKITAKELNVPVIALSQLSREVEKRGSHVPQLSDLRESGALEQDADMVCFLYKPSEGDIISDVSLTDTIYFKIAAYRNGEPKTFEFEFKGEFQRFSEKGITSNKPNLVPVRSTNSYYDDNPF